MRIVNGVEEEIQPSDIKEGTIIIVRMEIPKEAKNKDFRILHIHSKDDIEFVEYTMDNENIYVHVDRLSQFAFVNAKDKGLSAGAVTGIVIAGIAVVAVLFFLFFLLKRRKKKKKKRKPNPKQERKNDRIIGSVDQISGEIYELSSEVQQIMNRKIK